MTVNLVLATLLALGLADAAAQSPSQAPFARPATAAEEATLALSALPEAMRAGEGFGSGRFRAPRRGGVAYMMSIENYVHNGQRVVRYVPHVMCYAPYATNRDIGSTGKELNAPWALNEGSPHAYIIVVTNAGA